MLSRSPAGAARLLHVYGFGVEREASERRHAMLSSRWLHVSPHCDRLPMAPSNVFTAQLRCDVEAWIMAACQLTPVGPKFDTIPHAVHSMPACIVVLIHEAAKLQWSRILLPNVLVISVAKHHSQSRFG
jgi:hypothetical protein